MNPELFVMITLAIAAIVVIWVVIKLSHPNPSLYSIKSAAVLVLMVLLIMMLISFAIELDQWEEENQTITTIE